MQNIFVTLNFTCSRSLFPFDPVSLEPDNHQSILCLDLSEHTI